MGKRSDFERKPRDYYPTPIAAVKPLIPHLPLSFTFCEPMAGDGRLIDHIEQLADSGCTAAYDIEPQGDDIDYLDAFDITEEDVLNADFIITNPPWDRKVLHPLISIFSDIRPTWLLFDADWVHTLQSSELVSTRLCKIVSVGRVKWIEDSAGTGKDNCSWYLFDKYRNGAVQFYGR